MYSALLADIDVANEPEYEDALAKAPAALAEFVVMFVSGNLQRKRPLLP